MPSVDGSDGGKVVFNESLKLPATLFVRKTGGFQKKSVIFALLEDEGSKAVKISRQLATGELDLSQFGNLAEACSTSIPLSIGLRGTHSEGDPTLFLRVSTSERCASSSSKFPARLSSEGGPDIPQGTSYFLSESDDSEEEQIKNEESPRSLDDESRSAEAKVALKREILFSPHAVPPTDLIFRNSVSARERPASPPSLSDGQSSGRSFSDAKVGGETGKEKVESLKWSEEEKRQILISLSEPRKSLAAAAKTLDKAAKSVKAAKVSFGKSVEAPRRSFTDKSLEGVRNSSAGKNLEPVAASAETYRMAEAAAASAAKAVEEATAILGNSVVAAAAIYAAKRTSLSKDGRPSEGSIQELPPSRSSTSPPPDSGGKLDQSESRQTNPVAAPISPPQQAVAVACIEKVDPETKEPDSEDPNDEKKAILREAKTKFAMIERRTLEELRSKVAAAEANEKKGKEIVCGLEEKLLKREDELRDTAAIEAALYSVTAEHTSSSHKVHTPARRLARFYLYAFKNCSPERRASAARNSVLGLVVAIRASGNDVPSELNRMTYWWSNIVVLRESIMQACTVEATGDSGSPTTSGSDNSFADRARRSQQLRKRIRQGSFREIFGFKSFNNDWKDCNTYVVALLKVETWVYGRILECVWWQAMAPPMQVCGGDTASRPGALGATYMNVRDELNRFAVKVKDGLSELNKFAGDVKEFFTKERQHNGNLSQLGDARQGTISIEIWKNALTNALKRLCPLQGHDAECGCLPVLSRQVIEECVDRLDVAIFNAIMRNPEDKSPTDPLADPITDLTVLPIPAGHLSFGAGSELKNAVVTWSTWLSALLSVNPNPTESISKGASVELSEQPVEEQSQQKFRATRSSFDNLLKATGELFNRMQLPKDSIDMGMRREAARNEAEKASPYFVLLRAAGDLLMLPKEMLMDKAMRNEVCPQLKLPLIRRILCNFVPDEFAPEPISPALVAAIDTEVSLERQDEREIMVEEMSVAPVPDSSYTPPSSAFVRLWIGEPPGTDEWGITASSLLRKGYGSDDELRHLRTPLIWLSTNSARNASSIESDETATLTASTQPSTAAAAAADDDDCAEYTARFQLLQEVWGPR